MKLTRYRVTEFRSIEDSGWIDISNVTTLVGTNESGKTNLLVPLWKLNPSEKCDPDAIQDMPRKKYHAMRNAAHKPVFITGCFKMNDEEFEKFATLAACDVSKITSVFVGKNYDSQMFVEFVDDTLNGDFSEVMHAGIQDAVKEIGVLFGSPQDAEKKAALVSNIEGLAQIIDSNDFASLAEMVAKLKDTIFAIDPENASGSKSLQGMKQIVEHKDMCLQLGMRPEIKSFVLAGIPKFVYYSSYGNIDSEIYLPQVINNFQRTNLGVKEQAKVRTLKMLFDFVKLDPIEIQMLGKEGPKGNLNDEQIKLFTKQKKEREILLQSAATEFTTRFRNWWKQGAYTFDFQADGDFFRIWVSDDLRNDKIELESRSTGLQWFFSFYLTYLIQSENKSLNSMLLLDEPGLTLHPLAQEDLFDFFEGLSHDCQLMFSTHSPYLISTGHLSRVVSVYVDDKGHTVTSNDLRNSSRVNQIKSVYPVHSAINLLISRTMLTGCIPVIVDSVSDQIYMNVLKNYLVGQGEIKTNRELVFIPSGGENGIKAVLPILVGKNNFMPFVILGNTPEFIAEAARLKNGIFNNRAERIVNIGGFGIENAEIEDLIPSMIMQKIIVRNIPKSPYAEEEFEDVYTNKVAIVNQVSDFAEKYELVLPKNWREEVANKVKLEMIKQTGNVYAEDKIKYEAVKQLFERISKL